MSEQVAAVSDLARKQKTDRQFLLGRLESALSRVLGLEKQQRALEHEVEDLKERLHRENETASVQCEAHAKELREVRAHNEQMGARLGHIENMLASHPYLAFSRAAHSPKANEDAFDAGYLSRAAPLTTETSFAFGMPDSQPGQVKDTPHWQQQAPTTTWDLLNFSEDLPPMADTIRQSFLPDQQNPLQEPSQTWQEPSSGNLLDRMLSDACEPTEKSYTDSEYNPRSVQTDRTGLLDLNSRVTSISSLPGLDPGVNPQNNYPMISIPSSTSNPVPPENQGYPSVFEPVGAANDTLIHPASSIPALARRDASIKSQKIRFEQMCELEARNVEQEIVRSNVFEALSKAGEMLKATEQLLSEADAADQELGRWNHDVQALEDRTDVHKGVEFRANKARNSLESSYSRLCSALDFATQRQNVMTHEQKAQRSSSTAMKNLKALLGRKEPENAEPQDHSAGEAAGRPNLGRGSVQNQAGPRPSSDPAFTSPLGTAVDRLRKEARSPQRGAPHPPPSRAPTHRRTHSDSPMFPPTPELSRDSQTTDRSQQNQQTEKGSNSRRMSDAELRTLISELEERRLALYRT